VTLDVNSIVTLDVNSIVTQDVTTDSIVTQKSDNTQSNVQPNSSGAENSKKLKHHLIDTNNLPKGKQKKQKTNNIQSLKITNFFNTNS
jgi:hypothetical protein